MDEYSTMIELLYTPMNYDILEKADLYSERRSLVELREDLGSREEQLWMT